MTTSEFAKRHGVSRQAVVKALKWGRFSPAAVRRDWRGRWVFVDVALADREWDANANPAMRPAWPLRGGSR